MKLREKESLYTLYLFQLEHLPPRHRMEIERI